MRAVFQRWKSSGQSLMAFGRAEGISYQKLLYWKKRIDVEVEGASPELVPVNVVRDAASAELPANKFEVWLTNGVSLDVRPGFDETELRRLVGVLQSC